VASVRTSAVWLGEGSLLLPVLLPVTTVCVYSKGLEEDVVAKMERSLTEAIRGLRGQREQERKETQKVGPLPIAQSIRASP
jgi:hypothetical protein